jgi:hypothetical protein
MRWPLPYALAPLLLGACHASIADVAPPPGIDAGPPPGVTRVGSPQKVFQLLGDVDRQFDPPQPVPGQTLTRYGIVGADLGYPVPFQGKTLFLFADVVGTDDAVTDLYADAVGWTTSLSPGPFSIDFFPAPVGSSLPFLPLTVNGLILGGDDGPSSGFVYGDDLYGFMRVGSNVMAIDPVTGKAAGSAKGFLAVSHDSGMTFSALFDLPSPMVATQPAVVATSSVPGVGWSAPQTLLVWGHLVGAPVLAAAPFAGLADPRWSSTWRWWTGSGWSSQPEDASGIYAPDDGCVANFGLSYVAGLDKWLLAMRCPGPAKSTVLRFRVADSALGPWSERQVWFDPAADQGYCHFIHQPCGGGVPCCDQDFTGYSGFTETLLGYPYGPYLLPQLGTWDPSSSTATIYSLMSTFNPYTPVLMQTRLQVSGEM